MLDQKDNWLGFRNIDNGSRISMNYIEQVNADIASFDAFMKLNNYWEDITPKEVPIKFSEFLKVYWHGHDLNVEDGNKIEKLKDSVSVLKRKQARFAKRINELMEEKDFFASWNMRYEGRIEELEQLCCDLYYAIFERNYDEVSTPEHNEFMKRMAALGLLEGEENG